jgi:hypothetical protein
MYRKNGHSPVGQQARKGITMEQKHSGLGIASFITSFVASISLVLLVVIAGALEVSAPGWIDEESVAAMVLGLFIFALLVVDIVALGLGIAGLIQKKRKKLFAILGTVFAAATILGILFLIVIGNSM